MRSGSFDLSYSMTWGPTAEPRLDPKPRYCHSHDVGPAGSALCTPRISSSATPSDTLPIGLRSRGLGNLDALEGSSSRSNSKLSISVVSPEFGAKP